MAINSVALRVSYGVKLLNQTYPDWREHIDLDLLDMNSASSGLLEQLYGNFAQGVHALGIAHHAADYGFDIKYDRSDEQNIRQWQKLTDAWTTAISDKKHEKTPGK